jgi:predicted HicB family RNase H-like nuclease
MTKMRYGDYVADISYDEEDRLFHGTVMNIRDVVNFEGRSVEELEKEFGESVDFYLEVCRKEGAEPSKPYSGKFQVRMTPEQHRAAARAAARRGMSLNAWVTETLEREVAREED